ncbi:MAG TPA: hypothetical protein VK492_15755 [Chitinophagaceae bacterium]|nr:hypothetical protein [Chitinophagaceae bacterium]
MKSFIIEISISASVILTSSCNDKSQSDAPNSNQDSIIDNMTKAKNSDEKVEGKFLNIQKLTDKTYTMSIQLNQDSIAIFETYMPLDQNEISLLKKDGNNIILTYKVYQDPETKKPTKMVQYMQPVYEIQRK